LSKYVLRIEDGSVGRLIIQETFVSLESLGEELWVHSGVADSTRPELDLGITVRRFTDGCDEVALNEAERKRLLEIVARFD
jgi:hypothetical protein